MQKIEKYIGALSILVGLAANPIFVAQLLSVDNRIESLAVNIIIILFDIMAIFFGVVLFKYPIKVLEWVKNNWKNILLLVIVYTIGEFFILLSGIFVPRPSEETIHFFKDFLAYNEDVGFTMKPNLENFEVTWLNGSIRGTYSSDEAGFLNKGIDYNKASLFFIGDSFTMGSWVPREKAFFSLIGESIKEEVITFGIGSYNMTNYEALAYGDFVPKNEKEKIVFLALFANDLEESYPVEDIDKLFNEIWAVDLINKSFLDRFQLEYSALGQIKKLIFNKRQYTTLDNGLRLYNNRGASISFKIKDYKIFGERLRSILESLQKREDIARTVILLLPSRESVYKEEFEDFFKDEVFLENERFGFEFVESIGEEFGVPTLDLTPIFRERKDKKHYFDVDPHWNEEGHALAAEATVQWLNENEEIDLWQKLKNMNTEN